MKTFFKRLRFLLPASVFLAFCLGAGLGSLSKSYFQNEDRRFERCCDQIFRQEIQGNSLTLHYTLAHPEDYHVKETSPTLGTISTSSKEENSTLKNYEKKLTDFSYHRLSEKNQITYDMLLLSLHTLQEGSQYQWLTEYISPTLGVQAQLPILLAEYHFQDKGDVEQYLALLEQTGAYFQDILSFEQEKSRRGYFMTDTALDQVLSQCNAFTRHPEENYLLNTFRTRLKAISGLSSAQQEEYQKRNQQLVLHSVIPAYQRLVKGLSALRGSGRNAKGLCFYPEGQKYYCYLLKTQVGVYLSPSKIRQRLASQLMADYQEMGLLLQKNPSLLSDALNSDYTVVSPQKALEELLETCRKDFPDLKIPSYQVKYVDESLSPYLSPAFYLTPPVDTLTPNSIYINPSSQLTGLSLYTTLAHEGFPGHMYQTQYFGQSDPSLIRYLPGFGGYVEGWATYIESYAYSYAKADPNLTRFLWLNRSINLNLCSLVDMGIHYYGWSLESTIHYLSNFQIRNPSSIQKLYETILENPCNYLRYYLGYLNFYDLREEMAAMEGDEFQPKEFHKQVLEIGPVQFPVLRKHLGLSVS